MVMMMGMGIEMGMGLILHAMMPRMMRSWPALYASPTRDARGASIPRGTVRPPRNPLAPLPVPPAPASRHEPRRLLAMLPLLAWALVEAARLRDNTQVTVHVYVYRTVLAVQYTSNWGSSSIKNCTVQCDAAAAAAAAGGRAGGGGRGRQRATQRRHRHLPL